VTLDYEALPSRPGVYYLGVHTKFKSDKSLTIGDAIDLALQSKTMRILDTKIQRNSTNVTEDISATEKIVELERQQLRASYVTVSLNDTIVRPLPLTDAEYLRYKPKGDELPPDELPGDDSFDDDSTEDDSSEDDSAEDDSAEDGPTGDEPIEDLLQ